MADFFFGSRRANVGHGVEGPQQHVNATTHEFDKTFLSVK